MKHVPTYNKPSNPGSGGSEMGAAKRVAAGKVDTGTGSPHRSSGTVKTATGTTKRGALDS